MTNHAHVDSAVAASVLVGVVSVVDVFVNIGDGHPAKAGGYVGLFFVLYVIFRILYKKLL